MKICTGCQRELDIDLFPKTGNRCKRCKADYLREWYHRPPEQKGLREKQGDVCQVEGCTSRPKTHNLCQSHYDRQRRRGTFEPYVHSWPPEGETKVCSRCHIEKNCELEFYNDSKRKGYKLPHCKECHKGNAIENSLKRNYGITLADYDRMFEEQNGLCSICARPQYTEGDKKMKRFVVDHDHDTGKVRGLLHNQCNRFLGMAEDSIEILQGAVDYLRSHK